MYFFLPPLLRTKVNWRLSSWEKQVANDIEDEKKNEREDRSLTYLFWCLEYSFTLSMLWEGCV